MNWVLERFVWGKDMGSNPASVDVASGMLYLNPDVWHSYTNFQRQFLIAHEEGHYLNPQGSEEDADLYALEKLAGTEPKSLAKSIATLEKVPNISENRLNNLYIEALKIDARMGNENAKNELKKIGIMTGKNNNWKPRRIRRADGGDTVTDNRSRVEPSRSHKINGFVIGGFYFSFTNILLMIAVICLIRNGRKTA